MASNSSSSATIPTCSASPASKSLLRTDTNVPVQIIRTPTKVSAVVGQQRKPITLSPNSRVLIKPPTVGQQVIRSGIQPVTGSKLQYVRLVTTSGAEQRQETIKVSTTTAGVEKVAISQGGHSLQTINAVVQQQHQPTTHRLLLPAGQHQTINLSGTQSLSQLKTQLPPGTTLITSAPTPGQSGQGQVVALLPAGISTRQVQSASMVRQIQPQQTQQQQQQMVASQSAEVPAVTEPPKQHRTSSAAQNGDNPANRQRKPCNCTKSQCLKLYCDCFANGEFCANCNCNNCANNLEHEEERQRAIKQCLDRNPHAFHPKIGKGNATEIRRHQKGCNCKRSGCLKNYCECYEAKIPCGSMCKCVGCKNYEESPERKTLMHLADAAEVRTIQQNAARNKLSNQFSEMRPVGSHKDASVPAAHSYLRLDVIAAITNCMIAQCHEAETARCKDSTTEKLILEEFGRGLSQIIQESNKHRSS